MIKIIFIGFVLGIFSGLSWNIPVSFLFLIVILSIALLFLFFLTTYNSIENSKVFILFILCLITFVFGIARVGLYNGSYFAKLNVYDNKIIKVEGIVSEEPSERNQKTRIVIKTEKINGKEISSIKILLWPNIYPKINYGDRLLISGELTRPENFLTDNGREFNYVNYLSSQNIFYEINRPKVDILSSGEGSFIKSFLFSVKNKLLKGLKDSLPEPNSSLMAGLLLGSDEFVDQSKLDDFRTVGLIHIVVLSGYNLSIVSSAILKTLSFMPPIWGSSLAIIGIIFFSIAVGGTPTIVRAAIMASLALFARIFGREYDVLRALLLAGVVMVALNPTILVHSPSFQLSFLATFGIITLSSSIERLLGRIIIWPWLKEVIVTTLAAQIAVLPFILYSFGNFSLLSFPANLLVLPIVPWAMLFGFLSSILALFSHILSFIPSVIAYFLTSLMFGVSGYFANVSWASYYFGNFSIWWIVAIYGLGMFFIRRWYKSDNK